MRCASAHLPTISKSICTSAATYLRPSATMMHSLMYGLAFIVFSISEGVRFLPPAVIMMSLRRSTMRNWPSSSLTTSPVCSQPSMIEAAVASGLL